MLMAIRPVPASVVRSRIDSRPRSVSRYGPDLVAAGAAAVLGDVEGPAQPALLAGPAHQDDRIGVREDIPLADRLGDQVVEQDVGVV